MTQRYGDYEETNNTQDYDNINLKFTPYTTITAEANRVFGTETEYGQSMGVNFSDVHIEDGALYLYPEKDTYKLFSWKDVAGLSVSEALERGNEPSVDDADEIMTKSYASNDITYELVAARIPEVTAPDGDVVLEAESKQRTVEGIDDGVPEFSEWEDLDGDVIEIGETITWYNGSEDYGASSAAQTLLETLSMFGSNAVEDEDDIYGWMPDVRGEDIMRDDLEGRRIRFFTVTRESDNGRTYHAPIVEDYDTGEQIRPNNKGNESGAVQDAKQADAGSVPEPVADFINSGKNLNLTEDRAENLLDELLDDGDNSMTPDALDEAGGRDEVIQRVI